MTAKCNHSERVGNYCEHCEFGHTIEFEEILRTKLYKIKSRIAKDNFIRKMIREHRVYL